MGLSNLICSLLQVYLFCLLGRIILSWFPIAPGSALAGVFSFLYTITEPVLGPIRRAIPSFGGFGLDLSPIVVLFGINILRGIIC